MTNSEFRVANPEPRSTNPVPRWAAAVCDGIHAAGSRDVVYVPDNPLSHVLRDVRERLPDVRLVLATREEEAFGIAAGLFLGGKRPTVMLQSSGLGNSLNALTSLLIPYRIPVLFVVSMRGDLGEWNAAQVPMGRAVRSILEALEIPHVAGDNGGGRQGRWTTRLRDADARRVSSAAASDDRCLTRVRVGSGTSLTPGCRLRWRRDENICQGVTRTR